MPFSVPHLSGRRALAIVRIFRYLLYAFILVVIWWITSRFAFFRLEHGDGSITGVSGMRRIVVERLDEPASELRRGDVICFAMRDAQDRPVFRVSRIVGLPGDEVGERDGRYTVNGEDTGVEVPAAGKGLGLISEGHFFALNDNPFSTRADSRRLGWLPEGCVMGRFLSELPF